MAVCGGERPPSPNIGLGLGLMSCVKIHPQDHPPVHHHEGKKKGFHPLRGLRRIFRRMQRSSEVKTQPSPVVEARSRSASQLLDQTLNVVHSGLSVSHDSVFCPSQHSVLSSSFSIHQLPQHTSVTAELADVVRKRKEEGKTNDDDDDDTDSQSHPMLQIHSLPKLDSTLEQNIKDSRTTSKFSSEDNLSSHADDLSIAGNDISPLSHSAARHKMAVRPKRKHAATRHRSQLVPLPSTPEVNEEIITIHASVQKIDELLPMEKEMSSRSASLPLGVTPITSQDIYQDGFFSRLLSRRSGKSKKSIDSRQRIQPLTIPASSVLPKSQSFKQDDNAPIESTETPIMPNIEATRIWVDSDENASKEEYVEVEAVSNTVWVSHSTEQISESHENNLLIPVGAQEPDNDVIVNVQINTNDINCTESEISGNSDKEESIEKEKLVSLNSPVQLQNCSIVPINIDEIQEKSMEINEATDLKKDLCKEDDTPDFTYNEPKKIHKSNETNTVLNDTDLHTNDECIPKAVSPDADATSDFNEKNDIKVETPTVSSTSPKNEEFKFEIKSMSDEKKHTGISLGDRKLSLSELSSLFEKETENSIKVVTRQKSFSFSKQSTVSKENALRKFDAYPKVEKPNIDLLKGKQESTRKKSDNDDSVFLPSEKEVKKEVFEVEVLKRRSSREFLKHKEEEPELLKVFARRSLKVKDSEEVVPVKSRESDKENEDAIAERKKVEYQRSISTEDCILSIHNVCRQRSKTLPELSHHKPINIFKEVEALDVDHDKEDKSEEHQFIRIQQRKEVWEKRAQEAMGK